MPCDKLKTFRIKVTDRRKKNETVQKELVYMASLTFVKIRSKLTKSGFEPTHTHPCFTATHSSTMQLEQLKKLIEICQFAGIFKKATTAPTKTAFIYLY